MLRVPQKSFATLLISELNKTKWGWRATDEPCGREIKEFGTKRLIISKDDENGWKRVSVCNIPNVLRLGGRGDSKERQEGGVGHQGRRDGEVGTTSFEVHVVQEDVKT